mgnify:CR=1 FL=1
MNRIELDCLKYPSKKELLSYLRDNLEEMYSLNYDSLLDALTGYEFSLEINIKNKTLYEDYPNLKEVFEIVTNENKNVRVNYLD